MIKPGHAFGRIHRDDIVSAVLAAMLQQRVAGARTGSCRQRTRGKRRCRGRSGAAARDRSTEAVRFEQVVDSMARWRTASGRQPKVSSRQTRVLGLCWRIKLSRRATCHPGRGAAGNVPILRSRRAMVAVFHQVS